MKLLLPFFLLFSSPLFAQTAPVSLFRPLDAAALNLGDHLTNYTLLSPDTVAWQKLLQERPAQLTLTLPFEGGMTLELQQHNPLASGFRLTASNASGGTDTLPYQPGLHYRGKVAGAARSLVAISIFGDRIMGLISDGESNINLGRIDNEAARTTNMYVVFRDKHFLNPPGFSCGVVENAAAELPAEALSQSLDPCAKTTHIYVECAYKMYQDNGNSIGATADFVAALFNMMAALYQNEQIAVQISGLYVWTTPDPYPLTGKDATFAAFVYGRPTYDGDFAHLLTTASNDYGGLGTLLTAISCHATYALSNIYNTYSPLPTYSWSVYVMTHETGHNFGSHHTQWCGWAGGALDDCFDTETGCPPGPHPGNGGTIMSYCHLTDAGINFSNGFGAQPGDVIRSRVAAANCLYHTPDPLSKFSFVLNGFTATFSNTSSYAFSYLWNFGDGLSSTQANPTHTYPGPGSYNVCLAASDSCRVSIVCKPVNIPFNHCWHWQNPLPQGQYLQGFFPIDSNIALTAGGGGVILKTGDGGATWPKQASGTTENLLGIYFADEQTGWTVGENGTILKTNNGGANWLAQPAGSTSHLYSVWFTDNYNGWAVGENGVILKTSNGGTSWLPQPSGTPETLYGVCFTNYLRGWAVSADGSILNTVNGGVSWQIQLPGNGIYLYDIYFTDNETGWAAGGSGTIFKTVNSGINWEPLASGTTESLYDVRFINDQTGWAVGDYGIILKTDDGGGHWQQLPSGAADNLRCIHFANDQTGWAVGKNGTILKTSNAGLSWEHRSSAFTNDLSDVYFTITQKGWAVGRNGAILATSDAGASWQQQMSGTTNYLNSVYFTTNQIGWVVGADGTILKTTDAGASWLSQISGVPNDLNSVYFSGLLSGWAVGSSGKILKTSNAGTNWQSQTSGTTKRLNAAFFLNPSKGWVVGQTGTILTTNNGGTSWQAQVSGTNRELLGVYFTDNQNGWAVGTVGTILKTSNGGTSWQQVPGITTAISFTDVHFTSALKGWVSSNNGSILVTGNGGSDWQPEVSALGQYLSGLHFSDQETGWAVGTGGTILKFGPPVKPLTQNIVLCQNAPASPLTAIGSNLRWYDSATGGSGSSTAPVPATANIATTTYYVSQAPLSFGVCVESERSSITVDVIPGPVTSVSASGSCAANGVATAAASGGTAPYSYLWSNGETTAAVQNLAADAYTVTVTDSNGCSFSGMAVVESLTAPVFVVDHVVSPCPGLHNGSASATLIAAVQPCTFNWSSDENVPVVFNLAPGTYTVTVTDANGCTAVQTTGVFDSLPPVETTGGVLGCASPGVLISASSPGAGIAYQWEGPGNFTSNQAFNNVSVAGTYTVTVSNSNTCTASSTAVVTIEDKTGTFLLSANPSQISAVPPNLTEVLIPATIQNQEPNFIDLAWERVFIDLTPECESRVEDKIAYYPVSTGSGTFSLAAGESAPLDLHLTDSDSAACCGVVRLLCRNTCTLNDTLTMVYVAGCLSGTISPEFTDVQVFPNPGSGLFKVSGLPAGSDIFIRIFAMDGRSLLRDRLAATRAFSLEGYPAGVYIVVFEDDQKQAFKAVELVLR